MPKHILTVFLLFALPFYSFSQKYAQTTLLGYAEDSGANILDIDNEGNAYVSIASRYDITFQGKLYERHGALDYLILSKLNSSGKALWVRNLFENADCQVYDLKVDKEYNIYISGAGSNIKLDDGTLLAAGTFLIKFDKNGKTLWGIMSEKTQNMSSMTGGPIALAKDGVYWSSTFYGQLNLQGRTLNTNNPNGGSPDAFIARVTADGKVNHLYHDPAKSSIVQILVSSDNGNATAVLTRGGIPKGKVLLDDECKVLSDEPFLLYGDFPPPVRTIANGYEMIGTVYEQKSYGLAARAFYDVKFDNRLNVTDSVKLFDNPPAGRTVYNAINYNNKGYFFMSPPNPYAISSKQDWIFMDENKVLNILPDENKGAFGDDPITRRFVKVVGDTVHMVIRHLSYYTKSFTFDGKSYSTPSNLDATYFWAKYVYADPDSCKKITAQILKNGIEGNTDARIRFSLPASCAAQEDVVINMEEAQPLTNQNDFILPKQVIIKKGETETELNIKVIDDNVLEKQESFMLNLSVTANAANYRMANPQVNLLIDDNDNTTLNRQLTVKYLPEVKEGDVSLITVALPEGVTSSTPITFNFKEGNQPYQATGNTDYLPFSITLPAGTNSIQTGINTLADYTIEGDEFIYGNLKSQTNVLGDFTTNDSIINIKIQDVDNTVENRIFTITPETDILNEGNVMVYRFQLKAPYKLQRPVTIAVLPVQWLAALRQSATGLPYTNASTDLTLTYPDDNVIRNNKIVKLLLSANDAHTGNYRFMWNKIFTDTLIANAIDNDQDYLQLNITPFTLQIAEGTSGRVNVQLEGGRVLEDKLTINYQWIGTGINQDKRVTYPTASVTLPGQKNSLLVMLPVANNQLVDLYNNYQLKFTWVGSNTGLVPPITNNRVNIEIKDDDVTNLMIPNLFTPNGDGNNDNWSITNLMADPGCKVTVFNRLGTIVYYSTGYSVAWDGSIKGAAAPVGTYYYMINTRNKIFSGAVTIMR
jgi:gliding motility-associated-like protein